MRDACMRSPAPPLLCRQNLTQMWPNPKPTRWKGVKRLLGCLPEPGFPRLNVRYILHSRERSRRRRGEGGGEEKGGGTV